MDGRKKRVDTGNLRTLSIVLGIAGLIILYRIPPARMLGFVLVGAGAFGLIWAMIGSSRENNSRENNSRENEDHRKFF